jgi:hypothetical protein
MYAFYGEFSRVDSVAGRVLSHGTKTLSWEDPMPKCFTSRGFLYPSELALCQRVFEQVRAACGLDCSSLRADMLAAYILLIFREGTTDEDALLVAARAKMNLGAVEEGPYEVGALAEKYGLTARSAAVILASNGPSRRACDAAAKSFLAAVAGRSEAVAARAYKQRASWAAAHSKSLRDS